MKILILIISFFNAISIFACDCMQEILVQNFQNSNFVAKIKVIKVFEPSADGEYQDAEIQVLELYKGNKTTTIKIHASLKTDCNLIVPENTIWLVFARVNRTGVFEFGECSGSIQIDRKMNSKEYPNAEANMIRSINREISVLQYFKAKHIEHPNEFNLQLKYPKHLSELFKGFEGVTWQFAVYRLTIEKDLAISKIKAIKKFDNQQLSNAVWKYLKDKKEVNKRISKEIRNRTELIVVYYFYPKEGDFLSFVSERD